MLISDSKRRALITTRVVTDVNHRKQVAKCHSYTGPLFCLYLTIYELLFICLVLIWRHQGLELQCLLKVKEDFR